MISSILVLNGCRSTDKKIIKPATETIVETQSTTENDIVEEVKPEIKEVVVEKVIDNTIKDTDMDGIPDYVDEKPNQHISQTIVESGSQKLIILDNMKINSDKLTADMIKLLDNVSDVLSKESNLKIRIIGHTCDLGTDDYNMELSKKRALAADKYLLSKKVEKGYIEAVDLSEKSIENAQKNIQKNNVQLFVGDVVHYQPQESDFDFITLLDVIEHIPIEEHFNLFKNISTYISEKSLLLINIPNPEYIKYLHQNQPESLQVIDQPIELPTLVENLDKNNLEMVFFQKYGIWEQEDYHLFVVRKKREFKLRHLADERTLTQKITKKLRQKLDFIKFS